MDRLSDLCLRHRRWVVGVWLVLTVVGLALAGGLGNRLDKTFALPGQKAYDTNEAVIAAYGSGGSNPPAVVTVTVASGRVDTPAAKAALDKAFAAADAVGAPRPFRSVYPGTAGAPGAVDDPRLVSSDGRSAVGLVLMPEVSFVSTDPSVPVRTAVQRSLQGSGLAGVTASVTGQTALQSDSQSGGGSGVLAETALGAIGALIVLAFVFGSFVALLPMVMAAVSILTTFAVVDLLTTFTKVSFIVQFLIALIGLGVAIDYALLIVTRWREERLGGADNETAVRTSMRTAGHAVVFSGVTVAVGLFALVFLPVPFLRSVGYAGMLIPLVSVVVATTLLPVMLLKIGPFLDRPRLRTNPAASRPWSAWARLVVRQRWVAAFLALTILGGLGYEATRIAVGEPRSSTLSKQGPASDGLAAFRAAGFPSGLLTPIEVVTSGDGSAVVDATRDLPGVVTAVVSGTRPGIATVEVLPVDETSQPPGSHLVEKVEAAVAPIPGTRVGGQGAQEHDFSHAVYGSFPIMLAVILVLTFLLLARAFRSILLPLKAVLLNVLSVAATYGVMVAVWQFGHGSSQIWNISATGAITNWVPLMVFAFLFGLSMDYEVFILARMREEYDAHGATDAAVVEGIGRTGRLVSSAALILFLAFLSLSQAPDTDLKIMATGLGAGILLDATVVRALLVPALVSLFGRWNWALPARAATLLRVAPSPLSAPEVRGRVPEPA